ncbi:MAG: DUF3365 domain-containing protein [Arcobacteraceae bacterium]|nr:DUF3365 domain-containing protein [Arcobacteraceae bacterium]
MKKQYLIILFLLYIVLLVVSYQQTREYALGQAQIRLEEFLKNYKAIRTYISKYQKSEVYRLQSKGMIGKEFFTPNLLSSTFGARNINKIYNKIRVEENQHPIVIKFASNNPRNPLNKATQKESELLKKYNNEELKNKYSEIIETNNGTFLYYVLPTKLNKKSCMRCHSDPSLAPKELIEKYGDKNGFYEKIGDMRAILLTTMNIDDDLRFAHRLFLYIFLIVTFIFAIGLFMVNSFVKRITKESNLIHILLDSQDNIVVLTDGLNINQTNQFFLEFFQYKSLDEFSQEYHCICDFFRIKDGYYSNSLLDEGDNWIDYMLKLDKEERLIVMNNYQGEEVVFTVNFKVYGRQKHQFVITFTDITELNRLKDNLEDILEEKTKVLAQTNRELEESEHELLLLNENLEIKIADEIGKLKDTESKLFESEKQASMGDLIGNIAHQWRQPLSLISTASSGMLMQIEFGINNREDEIKALDKILNTANYLSNTIDDFRDLIKGNMIKKEFYLSEVVFKVLSIEEAMLIKNNIKIKQNIDKNISLNNYLNGLIQCFANIISNTKDAFVKNDIKERVIFIDANIVNNNVIIEISDNAGGIDDDIIGKVFEAYFTTKHQSQGTGLGLYLTYNIITNHMLGTIDAKNIMVDFKDKQYAGVKFTISLPLSSSK